MKKYSLFLAPLMLLSSAAHADLINVNAEAQYWRADVNGKHGIGGMAMESLDWDNGSQTRYSLALEHFIPLLPNVMIEQQKLSSSVPNTGDSWWNADFGYDAVTAYWAPLNNDTTTIHIGGSYRDVSGSFSGQSSGMTQGYQIIDEDVMLGYAKAIAGLPFTGFSVAARAEQSFGGDLEMTDLELSVRYRFLENVLDGYIGVGYRFLDVEHTNPDRLDAAFDFKGPVVNLTLRF